MSTNYRTPDDDNVMAPSGQPERDLSIMLKSILKGIGTVVVLGGFVYWLFMPTSTPGCGAKETQDTLFRLTLNANIKNSMQRLRNPGGSASFHLRNPTELGYDKETGTRSCMASIYARPDESAGLSKDTGEKIGFTIERNPEKSDEFIVRTVPIEFLKARNASKAAADNASKGKAGNDFGAPVGRDAIQAAVMEGLRMIDKNSYAPSLRNRRSRDGTSFAYADNVQNVLPIAVCRELDENRYGCPLQIEYRDALLGAIGASPWMLLKGEFVLVREGSGWKVDEGFSKAFLEAVVRGRLGIDDDKSG